MTRDEYIKELGVQFSGNLSRIRKERGMTQTDLAEKVGTYKEVISFYETGKRTPSLYMIGLIGIALGVSYDDLIPRI